MVGLYGKAKIVEWSYCNSKYTINAEYIINDKKEDKDSEKLDFINSFTLTISILEEEVAQKGKKSLKVDKMLVISDGKYDEYVNLFTKDILEFLERFSFCPEEVSFVI